MRGFTDPICSRPANPENIPNMSRPAYLNLAYRTTIISD